MYEFLLRMWQEKRVTDTQLRNYVTKGFITQEQYESITATPQEG